MKRCESKKQAGQGSFARILNGVERVGNKMCSPVTLYVALCLVIVACSAVFSGASVLNPSTGDEVVITSLITPESLAWMLTSFCQNVADFPTIVLGIVVALGVGLFEVSGMASALMRVSVAKMPDKIVVPTLLLISVSANIAGDAGFLVMPMIGALVFSAKGKNPIAGMALCYAGVAGGFSANFLVGPTDALLIGFTDASAKILDPSFNANIMGNWYFMAASVPLLVAAGTFVNNRFVEPRLDSKGCCVDEADEHAVTPRERKALVRAGAAELVFAGVIVAACVPANSPLRDASGSLIGPGSGLIGGIVPLIMLAFLIPAAVYGFSTGLYKNDKDLAAGVEKAVGSMSGYVLFCIVAAQMIAYFNKSNMGVYIAISGAQMLSSANISGVPLFIAFVLVCGLVNLLIASASAKWAFMSVVFVPMFMLMGYDPSLTQVLFRLGDSVTNPISPMFAYFAMLVGLASKYDKKAGFGSLISALLPYSIVFLFAWTAFLALWVLLGIPLGPGSSLYYPA